LISIISCSQETIKEEEKEIPVIIEKVEKSEIAIPIVTSGKVKAESEIMLSFKTGGIVDEIYVNSGESVQKGKILAKLNLSEIKTEVNKAKYGLEKAERDFNRVKSLYKDSVITLEQYQNAETNFKLAKATLESAEFNFNYSVIKAPVNGTIYKKMVEENEMVAPGNPIIIMGSKNNWIIKAGVTDKVLSKIKIRDTVNISLDALPDKEYLGQISEIGASANPYTGMYEVEIKFNNADNNIFSGMIANIKIIPSEKVSRYLIPIHSLVNVQNNSAEIYTLMEDRKSVKKIEVTVGEIINNK